ncbi:MAG TPA: cohesin domain-containing protein, partial [Blastocatellia bacterium]|nr:cohesin domain-containing protein [Blastocatellia bacterium]
PPLTQPIPSFRSGSGSVVNLTFQAATDSPVGATSALVISKLSAADAASGAVSIVAQNGTLSFGPPGRVISLPSVEGAPGATVSVPIYLSEGARISALQTIIRYDPDLLAPVSNNPVTLGALVPPRFSLVANTTVRGQVTLVIAPPISSPLPTFFSGGGTVATISFRVATEAGEGAISDLSLTSSASDSQGNAIAIGAQNGVFTVLSVRRGDVNRDGTINSQDIVRLILHLSGQQPLTGQALTSADMNDDGQITPQDLVLLIRLLAGIQ